MEKLILALVAATRKLRPYFQAHTIEVPTEYPMKQVLHKPETSGRLMKWALELSEFDIRYKPKTAIKGQVLADFVMEFTPAELAEDTQATPNLPVWKLSVDGAANAQGSDAGLIMTSLEGIDIELTRPSMRLSSLDSTSPIQWKLTSLRYAATPSW